MAAFLIGLFAGVVLVAVAGCLFRKAESSWEKEWLESFVKVMQEPKEEAE